MLTAYSVSLSKTTVHLSGVPNKARQWFEQSSDGYPDSVRIGCRVPPGNAPKTRRGARVKRCLEFSLRFGRRRRLPRCPCPHLLQRQSWAVPPNAEGVPGQLCTLRASVRLDITAGDPSDMGLPEHELRPDKPNPRPNPGGAGRIRGDPGVRFRSAFSRSVTRDIWGLTPSLAMSNYGMHAGASLWCGGVRGPSAP